MQESNSEPICPLNFLVKKEKKKMGAEPGKGESLGSEVDGSSSFETLSRFGSTDLEEKDRCV